MRIAVIVASMGRPSEIAQLIAALGRQTLQPTRILLSVTDATDVPEPLPPSIDLIVGRPGLCAQRNRALDALAGNCDVVVFFDDDFVPAQTALADIAALFRAAPDIVGMTGLVLADGVKSGGIPYHAAVKTIAAFEAQPAPRLKLWPRAGLYGCNMAFRAAAIGTARFDEQLVRHGWQEDVDFAARLQARGRLVKTNAFAGVHLGVNKGRSSGVALGYSQMVNPVYLLGKGTMTAPMAAKLMIKNFLANHLKAIRPEPFIDRRGRVRGNWWGLLSLLRGRVDPAAITETGSRAAAPSPPSARSRHRRS